MTLQWSLTWKIHPLSDYWSDFSKRLYFTFAHASAAIDSPWYMRNFCPAPYVNWTASRWILISFSTLSLLKIALPKNLSFITRLNTCWYCLLAILTCRLLNLLIGFAFGSHLLEVVASFSWKSRKITVWLKSFCTCRERTGIVVRRPEALGCCIFQLILAEIYRRIPGSIHRSEKKCPWIKSWLLGRESNKAEQK